jgi:putative endonuclease
MLLNDWLCWIPWRRSKYDLGGRGEDLAAKHLKKLGCTILERQYRDAPGEIDLIAREGSTIVFVEVRSRSGSDAGTPAETITAAKERTLIRTAEKYLHRRKLDDSPARFDVVSIVWGDGAPRLEHYRDAIRPIG